MKAVRSVGVVLTLTLVLVLFSAIAVRAEEGQKVMIHAMLAPPGAAKAPVTLRMTFYLVERDEMGKYKINEEPDTLYAVIDPSIKESAATFDVPLTPNKEYEVQVDALDSGTGEPLSYGAYLFNGEGMRAEYAETRTALTSGGRNQVSLPLGWEARTPSRANFVEVVPGSSGGFELVLYFNQSAVSGT